MTSWDSGNGTPSQFLKRKGHGESVVPGDTGALCPSQLEREQAEGERRWPPAGMADTRGRADRAHPRLPMWPVIDRCPPTSQLPRNQLWGISAPFAQELFGRQHSLGTERGQAPGCPCSSLPWEDMSASPSWPIKDFITGRPGDSSFPISSADRKQTTTAYTGEGRGMLWLKSQSLLPTNMRSRTAEPRQPRFQ